MTRSEQEPKAVLIVDDDPAMHKACAGILKPRGYDTIGASSGPEALAILRRDSAGSIGLILADLRMPGMDGITLLRAILSYDSTMPVIVMTGYGSIGSAVEAMKLGAMDYITKPFEKEQILAVINQAIALKHLRTLALGPGHAGGMDKNLEGFLGDTPAAHGIRELIDVAARNDCNILITGQSGTGKELVAHSIHRKSSRSCNPFIPVNCSAIPAGLMESEFFGHVKGAFTGADRTTDGLFQAADQGILFMDEISEMPTEMQAKLLRVLEDGKVRRVGSTEEKAVDVQIIAATNRNLQASLREGKIRMDLFYRLTIISIYIPPLCERQEDIPLLAQTFIDALNTVSDHKITGIDEKAMEHMKQYRWTGNVRELQNVIQSIFVHAASPRIRVMDLPQHIARSSSAERFFETIPDSHEILSLRQVEEEHIRRVLEQTGGNRTRAARLLGISRSALYNKLQEFSIA